jgi:hypothetical protein
MKKIIYFIVVLLTAVLTSCSDNGYLNAIPSGSKLLMSVNPTKISGAGNQVLLKTILHISNLNNTGLDLSSNIYVFEDARGNLGLCARVSDTNKLDHTLGQVGQKMSEKKGFAFFALPNHWIVGYSDEAALMMGPVLPEAREEISATMAKYLAADEEDGIVSTPIYAKLDSIDAPMALVCEAEALPEQFVAPFTLGAPRDAEASDIMIAAEMTVEKGCLMIKGETFSFKQKVNEAIQKATQTYRPIEGHYTASMSDSDAFGLFMNVNGSQLIELMRQNRGIRTMLVGINSAIDMDNIIKSIDGDMALITPDMGTKKFQMMMAARLKHADWLADVDYWKQSVPTGGHIGDWGHDCYYYTGDNTTYYFGVTGDGQYMSGGSKEAALRSVKPSPNPIAPVLQNKIKGERLAMVVHLSALQEGKTQAIASLLSPVFGHLNTIIYTLKVDSSNNNIN